MLLAIMQHCTVLSIASAGSSITLMSSAAFKHVVEVGNRHAQKLKDAFKATLVNQTRTKHRYQIEVE
jgi:hypothetical protein